MSGNLAYRTSHMAVQGEKTHLLRKQLEREIACLEKQRDRIKRLEMHLDVSTLATYDEMILARQNMLESLV